MSDDLSTVSECMRALKAARPFVVDGRGQDDAAEALKLMDAALKGAANYLQEENAKVERS